jgi:hypothetical protein
MDTRSPPSFSSSSAEAAHRVDDGVQGGDAGQTKRQVSFDGLVGDVYESNHQKEATSKEEPDPCEQTEVHRSAHERHVNQFGDRTAPPEIKVISTTARRGPMI